MDSPKTIAIIMENLEYGGATTHLKTLIKNIWKTKRKG